MPKPPVGDIDLNLSKAIRELKRKNEISFRRMAEISGFHETRWHALLYGKQRWTLENIRAACAIFKIRILIDNMEIEIRKNDRHWRPGVSSSADFTLTEF